MKVYGFSLAKPGSGNSTLETVEAETLREAIQIAESRHPGLRVHAGRSYDAQEQARYYAELDEVATA